MPSIITANLLRTGDVVYLGPNNEWVRDIADAIIADGKEKTAELEAIAVKDIARQLVVEVYPMDVELVDGKPKARSVREVIRAAHGPTV